MNILIACDKFKGSLTADQACRAVAAGIKSPEVNQISRIPIADGGEGIASALTAADGGKWIELEVTNPLGTTVTAGYGLINNGRTAIIEMAEASGLGKLDGITNDPWRATTFGTGELIADAIKRNVSSILLGIGGSATNDAGTGMAMALGFQFLGNEGEPLSIPTELLKVKSIIPPNSIDQLPEITVACDVTNPLLGDQGCTQVYGPQKGIEKGDFKKHEQRLNHLVHLVDGERKALLPGSGAAGGLGFGCVQFLNATLRPGFQIVAETLQLEEAIADADLVITGEGRIDSQSLQGKAPAGLAELAKQQGKPVIAVCGQREACDFSACFDEIWEIDRKNYSIDQAIEMAAELLTETVADRINIFLKSIN